MTDRCKASNTRLNYLYRDASNYKAYGDVVFAGIVTAARIGQLLDSLPTAGSDIRLFVPEQVGLPNLRYELPGSYEDDTDWNELTGVEQTTDPPTEDEPFAAFVSRCLAVRRWDPDPRIPHGTTTILDAEFHDHRPPPTAAQTSPQAADRWFGWGGTPGSQSARTPTSRHGSPDPTDSARLSSRRHVSGTSTTSRPSAA